jgi:hypothetical protein
MSDADAPKGLRDRLAGGTEDRLGRALSDLLEHTLLNGALGRASDAREKAAQAQELAMGALNLPSAADIERLTRRLRSVSQRLEGIEDGVHRLGRSLSGQSIDVRLAAIEAQLQTLSRKLEDRRPGAPQPEAQKPAAGKPAAKRSAAKRSAAKRASTTKRPTANRPTANRPTANRPTANRPTAKRSKPTR